MDPDRTPVLVGAAQFVERDVDPAEALEPLAMLERVARGAADDAGCGARALRELDTVAVIDPVAWRPGNAPGFLAETLGARPKREILSAVGGEIPLSIVEDVARRIGAGDGRIALIAGCHNMRTMRAARKVGLRLDWKKGGVGEPTRFGESRPGTSDREQAVGLIAPADVYPVFENALRAKRGLDLESHRLKIGALFSRFSEVASKNPYAWFPTARSAEEIATVTPANRMVAYPYTKYMNAVIETDQAAAILLMSQAAAHSLGVPEDRMVHWWGGAHGREDSWFLSERPDLAACPSLRGTVDRTLAEAGVAIGDLDHIDFYSCFPVAVEMACEMLGIDEADPRGLTVTGGLPYAGGPGNNYTLHSLATMMERLRARPGSRGLVTGNGWYLTKHSACVCSTQPVESGGEAPEAGAQRDGGVAVVDEATGIGTVEAYTVLFGRDGAPTRGIAIGRQEDDRRFLANTPDDSSLLEALVAEELVGRRGTLTHADGRNTFDPA